MILLEANEIQLYVEDRLLLDIEKLLIQTNDRIGLVGLNGSGKTTLLEVLAKEREVDSGTVASFATCELLPQLKRTNTTKSGGEVTQEYINQALAKKPEIFLADEPTTNLDTEHMEKLERQFKRWKGAIVLVSHDRAFLNALCTKIWELDVGKITEYKGNYSNYVEQKELERRQQESAYEQYEQKKKQLEEALVIKEQKAQRATKAPKKVSPSEARIIGAKPYFAKKQKKLRSAAKAIETRLEKLEEVEKVRDLPSIKMNLPNEEAMKGRVIIRARNLSGVIGKRTLWSEFNLDIKGGEKLAVIGQNGTGKTTLIKKVINKSEGIQISPAVKIGYFSQNLDILDTDQSILENVQSTSIQDETFIRTVLARLHFYRDEVYKKVNILSGGERVKVAFAKLFVSDINTLILDEPTNFLDIHAVEALESLLLDYEGTILLVSHDRQLIQTVATRILAIKNQKISLFDGTYNEYQRYIPEEKRDIDKDNRLLLETKISEILSRLSIEPSEELEEEFQRLLAEKRKMP